jgi:hypothetical protein
MPQTPHLQAWAYSAAPALHDHLSSHCYRLVVAVVGEAADRTGRSGGLTERDAPAGHWIAQLAGESEYADVDDEGSCCFPVPSRRTFCRDGMLSARCREMVEGKAR